jgi:hypothetical protein
MSKKKFVFFGILILCLLAGLAAAAIAADVTTSTATLKMIRFIEPKAAAKWSLGAEVSIHFEGVNITTTGYWVKLVKGGQVIGTLSHLHPLSSSGSGHYQLAIPCGTLTNGSAYGVGNNYQIQVATEDGSFMKRGPRFSVVALTIPD